MSELREALGHAAVLSLSEIAGGRLLRVPSQHRADSSLSVLVGEALARRLVEHFRGSRVYIPRGPSLHNGRGKMIDRRIVATMTRAKRTAQAIADHLDCTPRTIYKIRGEQRRSKRADRPTDRGGGIADDARERPE